ncbi:MAG TPA: hypothetical protein VMW45_04505 [Dehalococcoidia bacterium]|nr:hypothetical protein [Dehalococcoidia bacterium]
MPTLEYDRIEEGEWLTGGRREYEDEECPYVTHHLSGYKVWDTCEIAGDRCMLETQGRCLYWDEIKRRNYERN